jgi:uncharacterized Zn-binding protein involved in type VI secretion
MLGRLGTSLFGTTEFLRRIFYKARRVACVGDGATHPGQIITSGQDGSVFAGGAIIAVNGALFQCNIEDHGITPITPIIKKTYINGKLIVTEGAVSSCGAIMKPISRGVYAG